MKLLFIVLFLGIIVYSIWRGYKNGIIRGVCGILALFLSLYGAGIVADLYGTEFDGILTPFVSGMVDTAADNLRNFDWDKYDPEDPEGDKPPKIHLTETEKKDVYAVSYACSRQMGLIDEAAMQMAESVAEECDVVNQSMVDTLSVKLCEKLAYVAVYCLTFAILAIAFAVIGNVINLSFLIPKLGLVEPIIGAILGLARGIILMYAVAMFLRYLGIILPDSLLVEPELLFRLVNENPVAARVGL